MDTNDMWFHRDGATCHLAHATLHILPDRFEDMVLKHGHGHVEAI